MKASLSDTLKRFKLWQLVLVFVISLPISAWLLRQNNLGMVERRQAVILIDEQTGDIEQIEPKLIELRDYVTSHMNAGMTQPLELAGSYNQAVKDVQRRLRDPSLKTVYRKAEMRCARASVPVAAQAQCIQDYVVTNAGNAANSLVFPPKEQFVYSFVSPVWSLDLAGLSVLISALLGLAIAVYLFTDLALPRIVSSLDDDLE